MYFYFIAMCFVYVQICSILILLHFKKLCCYCCFSITKLCLTLCNPMDCTTPGFPVLHYPPELVQTHVHWVSDANLPSYPLLPFLSSPQPFTASGSFPVSQPFTSGGQTIEAKPSVLPMNIQGWFPLGLTGLISLLSKGLSRVFSSTISKESILWCSAFFMVQLSHPYMTTGKTIALTIQIFVCKVMSLLFNMHSRLIIAFLPKSKCVLISWLQSQSQWFWSPRKESLSLFPFFPHLSDMKW